GPLTREATVSLARALGAGEADTFGGWLFEETGGLPLFIAETLKALYEGGEWQPGTAPDPERLRSLGGFLAPGVRALIRRRIEAAGQAAERALGAAAVLGHDFDFDQLRAVADMEESDALSALEELLSRRLLREGTAVSSDLLAFGHDRVREIAYAEL